MHYHQISCSLDTFKFDMIVDDSCCRLNEPMLVHDSFSVSGFSENGLKARSNPKMATAVL